MLRLLFVGVLGALSVLAALPEAAAQSYPNHPISIVVPSAAGGLSDGFVRLAGDAMQRAWGQPVVMEHRPGAGGIVGTQYVAGAKPDGYTLLMGNIGPLAINPGLYADLPYDVQKQLLPVALVAVYPNVLVIHPGLPIHSIAELIRTAREKPGTLNFASAGVGQSQHLSGEMFKAMADVDIVHVAYKGTGPALTDLLGGHIQMMFSNVPAAVPYIQSGKLRALGVTSLVRSKALPDVPTIAEAGVPGYNVISWLALMAPAGTPRDIVERLHDEVMRSLASPEGQKYLELVGADAGSLSPGDLGKFLVDEQAKWRSLIRKANITVQ